MVKEKNCSALPLSESINRAERKKEMKKKLNNDNENFDPELCADNFEI